MKEKLKEESRASRLVHQKKSWYRAGGWILYTRIASGKGCFAVWVILGCCA